MVVGYLLERVMRVFRDQMGSQFFISPAQIDFSQLEGVTVQEWLDKNIHDTNRAEIIKTILNLNTYANDPDIQSIGSGTSPSLYG